jgi:2-amino-4-hydroxy-6-hydroxymethyldihydropteridine diphosphokinase
MTSSKNATAFISLGSNIDPEANLKRAIELMKQRCAVLAVSHAYRTPPQGFADQADFLNLALKVQTDLDALTLKHDVLDWIERELKRVRDPNNKNAPRTIDLDISLWNDEVFDYGEKPWHIPDPDILRFAHVALPLAEIAPDYIHPIESVPLRSIAARFSEATFEMIKLISENNAR